jgi:hypothetical protein
MSDTLQTASIDAIANTTSDCSTITCERLIPRLIFDLCSEFLSSVNGSVAGRRSRRPSLLRESGSRGRTG